MKRMVGMASQSLEITRAWTRKVSSTSGESSGIWANHHFGKAWKSRHDVEFLRVTATGD
jgi:hypothetical protein